jgi:hypothetical protein
MSERADTTGYIERLFAAMDAGARIEDIMREEERAAGRQVVVPGEVDWLSVDDWHPTIVVSVDGRDVRLVAILALRPGSGALTRTVAAIRSAGLRPVIVEPTREMRETCRRWGWRVERHGDGFDSEERWMPAPTPPHGEEG